VFLQIEAVASASVFVRYGSHSRRFTAESRTAEIFMLTGGLCIQDMHKEILFERCRRMKPTGKPGRIIEGNSSHFISVLCVNILTEQLQEPITESAQENKIK
jgi:hypothetical protein